MRRSKGREKSHKSTHKLSTLREGKYTYTKRTDLSLEENTSIPEGF